MDNDNKVIVPENKEMQIHQEVMLFLGDEVSTIHKTTGGQFYEIEKEYEKTKKHKSPFAIIVLAGCFIVIMGLAFVMHKVISTKNQEISVSLEEFNDLNLRTLLDTVSSAQTNYDNAIKNKAQIQADMESKLKTAEETLENDIFVIDSMNLKYKTVYNDRVAAAKNKYAESVKAIQDEFGEKLALAEKEVEAYKSQLAEFDTAKIESARQQEKALDSERKLRELETKKLTDKYEKRIAELEQNLRNQQIKSTAEIRAAVDKVSKQYQHEIDLLDPTIRDEAARMIIDEAKDYETPDFDGAAMLVKNSIASEKVTTFINNYQEIYDDFKYLDDVVASIPQKNSIPKYVSSARILVNDMGEAFVDTTISFYEENEKLAGTVETLNNTITKMNKDFETERNNMKDNYSTQLKTQKEFYEASVANILTLAKTNAIILTATDYDNILIYVAPKARYLISEEDGSPAELKVGKGIKGRIYHNVETDFYYFTVDPDKEGNIPEIDFTVVEPGSSVKILSK